MKFLNLIYRLNVEIEKVYETRDFLKALIFIVLRFRKSKNSKIINTGIKIWKKNPFEKYNQFSPKLINFTLNYFFIRIIAIYKNYVIDNSTVYIAVDGNSALFFSTAINKFSSLGRPQKHTFHYREKVSIVAWSITHCSIIGGIPNEYLLD